MTEAQHITFDQYIESERYTSDFTKDLPEQGIEGKGYIYLDGFFIHEYFDEMRRRSQFTVPIGNTEELFDDLEEARQYLWDEWVDGEIDTVYAHQCLMGDTWSYVGTENDNQRLTFNTHKEAVEDLDNFLYQRASDEPKQDPESWRVHVYIETDDDKSDFEENAND